MDASTIREIVIVIVPMILSLTVHEFAHAWSAFKLGDDTAARQGRMTLNPLVHIDPIGTLLIPIFSVLNGGISLIGWAKPVPVSPFRFRKSVSMRNGMLITALAGPASNLVLAFLFAGAAMLLFSEPIEAVAVRFDTSRMMALYYLGQSNDALMIIGRVFFLNISLAVFNMLPIPPLDGSRVLPLGLQDRLMRYQMVVFLGLIVLINFASSVLMKPILAVGNAILAFFGFFV